MNRRRLALLTVACAAALAAVLTTVDLAPRVEPDFFFASDDPQLAATTKIEALFPSSSQLLLRAAGPRNEAGYLESLGALTETLEDIPGVRSVYSLTEGPSSPAAAAASPLWSRLLLPAEDPAASLLLLQVDDADPAVLVANVEGVMEAAERPGFRLDASGVPYVVELIRRHLLRDLQVFSLASLLLFGLSVAWIYRSLPVVLGSLMSCMTACAGTLMVLHLLGLRIGLLTANIATIVFVLTLSHVIFLSASWRAATASDPVRDAVRQTLPASFWCMVTTALGFSSLLFASARPLRELGIAGAIGSLAAIVVAYTLYPAFLRVGQPDGGSALGKESTWAGRPLIGGVLALAVLTIVALPGLLSLETDPSLLAYFDRGGELYRGLAAIDHGSGSSPLEIVVAAPDGGTLHRGEAFEALDGLQKILDEDPAVGSALSLPVLLSEARRNPLAGFLSADQLLALLDSPTFGGIASSFVTEDRTQALLFLRMREEGRTESRQSVVDRLTEAVREQGLEPVLVGGLFDLQGRLSRLVARSLLTGLAGLTALFAIIATVVSRSTRTSLAMLLGVIAVPVLIFGVFGHLGVPLDVISSPAANVAVAVGIDSMIHLVLRRRRILETGVTGWEAWAEARRRMAAPIISATLVVAAGFGIFALSSFPPTRHFGVAVVLGTLAAAALALLALPYLASRQRPQRDRLGATS